MIKRARNLKNTNPDVMDFSQVTGVTLDMEEDASEEKHKDNEGKCASFIPHRYTYSYDFDMGRHPRGIRTIRNLRPWATRSGSF